MDPLCRLLGDAQARRHQRTARDLVGLVHRGSSNDDVHEVVADQSVTTGTAQANPSREHGYEKGKGELPGRMKAGGMTISGCAAHCVSPGGGGFTLAFVGCARPFPLIRGTAPRSVGSRGASAAAALMDREGRWACQVTEELLRNSRISSAVRSGWSWTT